MIKRSTLIGSVLIASGTAGAFFLAPGCSSSSGSGGGVTPGTVDGTYTPTLPPKKPASAATGKARWYAMNSLQLGITAKPGTTAKKGEAWRNYGYDLDGRNTTPDDSITSKNSCKRKQGSSTRVLADGNGGIDNNFGQHVMSVISNLKADAEDTVNKGVTDGKFTLILRIDNATDTDNANAPGALYVANEFAGADGKPTAPKFSPTEVWPISSTSLTGGDLKSPRLVFPKGYIANGQWVSGDLGTDRINLAITLSGADVVLPIDSGVITVKMDGTDGTIAGAMNTTALQDALSPVAKKFGICPGNATYQTVVDTLTQSADLVSNKPQLQDTTVECNAISIALGFTMKLAGDHSSAKVITPTPDTSGDTCGGDAGPGGQDAGHD
ncbi:MAG: hypothetical protein NVS3B20_06690 [Polyangiales bacterium]